MRRPVVVRRSDARASLRELRLLLQRHGLDAALYGHFGQGCIHCRIDFELSTPAGIERYKHFTDEEAELCVRHGGSISGEHGDGQARGELLDRQLGPEPVVAFREFKQIWDPDDRMNPGKIVDGLGRADHLKLAIYHPPVLATSFHPPADHGDLRHAALRCVGIGNCRRASGGTMCPSFMVTHEEKHTTRGRARILYEMLQGDVIQDGWASRAVKDALDLCLSCKGCKADCPVHVDMATYKSEFLSHYYHHHLRPRHAYALGWIHRWARLGGAVPWLANFVTQTPALRRLVAWLGGMAPDRPIPRFADRPFTRSFVPRPSDRIPVILWPDTFNNHFFPGTLEAAALVLDDAGYRVVVPRGHLCCGRALYDYGMLELARRLWQRTLYVLAPAIARGVPIIGLEPSCVAAFPDELPALFPDDDRARRLCELTHTLPGFLRPRLRSAAARRARAAARTLSSQGGARLRGRARAARGHARRSRGAGLGVLRPGGIVRVRARARRRLDGDRRARAPAAVRAERADTLVITDGFSCREQLRHGTGRAALHVAEVIALALRPLRTAGVALAPRPSPRGPSRPDADR